jgi:HEAT repeat protein
VRISAALALDQIVDDRTVEPLVQALLVESNEVLQNAAKALGKLYWDPDRVKHERITGLQNSSGTNA